MSLPLIALALLGSLAAGWVALLAMAPAKRDRGRWTNDLTVMTRRTARRTVLRLPSLGGAAAAGLLTYFLLGLVAPALVVATLGWGASAAVRRWREARRSALLSTALVSAVDLLAQLLPAGHSTRQSLVVLAESGPVELRPEIAQILSRVDEVPLEEALVEAQERMRQPLFTLIAATLTVGNRSGGRLAPLLQELSRAAHQIDAVQGQLHAEQAQGRLGALVIAVMPLGLLALLHTVNPEYLSPYKTVGGELLLGGLIAVIILGYAWMVRILRLPEPDFLPLTVVADGSSVSRAPGRASARSVQMSRAAYAFGSGRYDDHEPQT